MIDKTFINRCVCVFSVMAHVFLKLFAIHITSEYFRAFFSCDRFGFFYLRPPSTIFFFILITIDNQHDMYLPTLDGHLHAEQSVSWSRRILYICIIILYTIYYYDIYYNIILNIFRNRCRSWNTFVFTPLGGHRSRCLFVEKNRLIRTETNII